MKKGKSARPSLGDVAKAAEISSAAACYALQNRPKVSPATRKRVLRIAKQLGYVPDARIHTWMARVRGAKTKDLLPIAWLNTYWEKDAWHHHQFLCPYLEGAQKQAHKMGYRIDEIWSYQPGMTMRRISQILFQRGIEGVIISYPARHFRLNWDHLAGVSLGQGLLAPQLHQVSPDLYSNLLLALKMVQRFGYQRIGICLDVKVDQRHGQHAIRATAHYLNASISKSRRVVPLFYEWGTGDNEAIPEQVVRWIRHEKPDVIIGHNNHLLEWAEAAGRRVPRDLGIVHLAIDDDVKDWAGIYSNKREIGADAVKLVVSLVQAREFGVPEVAMNTLVRGSWRPGRTLIVPRL